MNKNLTLINSCKIKLNCFLFVLSDNWYFIFNNNIAFQKKN